MAPVNIIYRCEDCGAEWDDVVGDPPPHEHDDAVSVTFQAWGSSREFLTWDEAIASLNQ